MAIFTDPQFPSLSKRLVERLKIEGSSDAELLTAFRDHGDQSAFESLIARHGPVVWGVCRRGLTNPTDAEDVFQATFLALVRQADRLAVRESSPALRWGWGLS